jgi:hypothetical protein
VNRNVPVVEEFAVWSTTINTINVFMGIKWEASMELIFEEHQKPKKPLWSDVRILPSLIRYNTMENRWHGMNSKYTMVKKTQEDGSTLIVQDRKIKIKISFKKLGL